MINEPSAFQEPEIVYAYKTQLDELSDLRKEVVQLRAALAAVRPDREGWQPIETAPKDGRTFYAIALQDHFEDSMHWALFWNGDYFECVSGGFKIDQATHWMIPKPPAILSRK